MLSDALGMAIAFISVILVVSIFVTTLVQTAQSLFRLRGRNLLHGLATILRRQMDTSESAAPPTTAGERRQRMNQAKAIARKVLNHPSVAKLTWNDRPTGDKEKFSDWLTDPIAIWRWLRGPAASWATAEELPDALVAVAADVNALGEDTARMVAADFDKAEAALSRRFAFNMRAWSAVWAIAICAAFQFSLFDVVNALASSSELRIEFEKLAADVEKPGPAGGTPGAGTLEDITFTVWPCGTAFYYGPSQPARVCFGKTWTDETREPDDRTVQGRRIIGVLLMGILVSLGAPFWFDILQNVVGLRDRFAPKKPTNGGGSP